MVKNRRETFQFSFAVEAPQSQVWAFHRRADALRILTPPPIWAQIHETGALTNHMVTRMTLWLGPFPIHWEAEHVDVDASGFADIQRRGPMAYWRHDHRFTSIHEHKTEVCETIELAYSQGWKGVWTRALFNRLSLLLLFKYRQHRMQRSCKNAVS